MNTSSGGGHLNGLKRDSSPPSRTRLISSWRLKICFILMLVFYAALTMRTNLGMALVCMVDSHQIQSSTNSSSLSSSSSEFGLTEECPAHPEEEDGSNEVAVHGGRFAWTASQQSLLFTATYIGSLPSMCFSGSLADKFDPKWILVGVTFIQAAINLLTPVVVSVSFPAYVASRLLQGVAEGAVTPTLNALGGGWFPPAEKATMAALYTSGNQLAGSLSSYVSAQFCRIGSWESIFYASGALGLVVVALLLIFVTSRPAKHQFVTETELRFIESTLPHNTKKMDMPIPLLAILRSPPFWANAVVGVSFYFCLAVMLSFLPLYFKQHLGLPLKQNGLYVAVPFVTQLISKNLAAVGSDRIKQTGRFSYTAVAKTAQAFASFGSALALAGLAIVPTCQTPEWALLFLFIYGLTFSCAVCGHFTSMLCLAPAFTGTVTSMTTAISTLGAIAGTQLYSAVSAMELPNKWAVVFGTAAVLQVISATFFLLFASAEVQPWGRRVAAVDKVTSENGSLGPEKKLLDSHDAERNANEKERDGHLQPDIVLGSTISLAAHM